MEYISTRGIAPKVSAATAIKEGIAPDGGLYVPESLPTLTLGDITVMTDMSYNERAVRILSRFLTDFTEDEIESCVNLAYTREKFDSANVAPLYELNDKAYLCELWHGPTCAFKDMALQLLPHLLTTSIRKTGEDKTVLILVATSGDTGKAALEGFKDVNGTKIMVFYPSEGVSHIQKLQMMTQAGGNVNVCGIEGNFDDAQTGVKTIFGDAEFAKKAAEKGVVLSSANSINWGRLVPQIVYYISSYCDLVKYNKIALGELVNFVVPTGNFGNILAAYYAYKMGLPVNKLICASNINNVLTEFFDTGRYNKKRTFHATMSPSMDILISSNLERLLFDISGDSADVREFMKKLSTDGEYTIPQELSEKISGLFCADYCDEQETAAAIADIYENYSYVCDTHTAVACGVYKKYAEKTGDATKTVIASTASPYKFPHSVLTALNCENVAELGDFEALDTLAGKAMSDIPTALSKLKNADVRFDAVCKKQDMAQQVMAFIEK